MHERNYLEEDINKLIALEQFSKNQCDGKLKCKSGVGYYVGC